MGVPEDVQREVIQLLEADLLTKLQRFIGKQ